METIGKYLCKAYYSGRLNCSLNYREGSAEYFLSRCVERPLEDAKNRRGRTAEVWRKLMSGDFAKLTKDARARAMGGRAKREGEFSIDGGSLCELEVLLYTVVGLEFKKLVANKGKR